MGGGESGFGGFGGAGAGAGFSFTDIMDAFFGGGAGGGQGRGPRPRVRRGQDALIALDIDLAEAAFGTTRELKVDTAVLCTTCSGEGAAPGTPSGRLRDLPGPGRDLPRAALAARRGPHDAPVRGLPRLRPADPRAVPRVRRRRPGPLAPDLTVKIPAGVDAGTRVQLSEQGEVGPGGGPAGDLYVELRVNDHPVFVRHGKDLLCTVTLPMTAAALGVTLDAADAGGRPR